MERNKVKKYGEEEILGALQKIINLRAKYSIDGEDIHFFEDTGELVSKEEWEN